MHDVHVDVSINQTFYLLIFSSICICLYEYLLIILQIYLYLSTYQSFYVSLCVIGEGINDVDAPP